MCYHKAQTAKYEELAEYYAVSRSQDIAESYAPRFHENGFDYLATPLLTAGAPAELKMFNWGLIPYWVKDLPSAIKLRTQTLNCISEEMFDKASFKDAAANHQRCLIPCTGFYEWRWMDEKGKTKIPYFISLSDQKLFSIGGLYARWTNRDTQEKMYTYTVLTTKANDLMRKIHNSKFRMPVIIPREYERDWLNKNLTNDDVLALCQPVDPQRMQAHTISKLITTRNVDTNVPEVMEERVWPETEGR